MEQPSRRSVLRAAVVAAGALAAPVALAAPAEARGVRAVRVGTIRLRRREFRRWVGSSFTLVSGTARYNARLVRIADFPRPGETRFSLLFQVTGGARPADGVYRVAHSRLKPFPLYLGSIGEPARGVYEAVVNY